MIEEYRLYINRDLPTAERACTSKVWYESRREARSMARNGRHRGRGLGGNVTASTFRLTLASVLAGQLGLRREKGRALEDDGEAVLTSWMAAHLEVAVAPIGDRSRLAIEEAVVLGTIDPPLNLQGMSPTPVRTAVTRLRRSLGQSAQTASATAIARMSPPVGRPTGAARPIRATFDGVPDVADFLSAVVGRTIPTLSGRPNRILRVEGGMVEVGTTRSPNGRRVEIAPIQEAVNRLFAIGELRIDVATVGYRSAFIGAVLAALPGTRVLAGPRRVGLADQGWPPRTAQ